MNFYASFKQRYSLLMLNKVFRIMKLIIVFLIIGSLQVNATAFSQSINLSLNKAPLEEAIKQIREQSGYDFIGDSKLINKANLITLKLKNANIKEALSATLMGQNLTYIIKDKIVIIKELSPKPLFGVKLTETELQETVVRGQITDEDKFPLGSVSIQVKGTNIGTTSNSAGNYTISVPENSTLVFTYIGYSTQEVPVNGRTTINITLQESLESLSEVVVTALGISRDKKSLSYSIQSVKADNLTEARTPNLVQGLSGKVSGLTITNAASGVGGASKVLLRGNRSISGSSQPLYIVDGIILNGDISNLSPDDVESISVLKGANAAALYGSRANNGAIIVVTKSGKGGPVGVSTGFGVTAMFNDPIILTKYQNEYGQGANGIYSEKAVTSWGPKFDGGEVKHWSNDPNYVSNQLGGKTTYPYVAQPNNIKDFFQLGNDFSTNLSVNVNTENSNTFLGYTHTDASGIVEGNNLQGHNLNIRTSSSLSDNVEIESKINYIRQEFDNVLFTGEGFNNPMGYLYQIPRNIRTQDIKHFQFTNEKGLNKQHFYAPGFNGAGNPYWTRNNVLNPKVEERVLGMLSLKLKITDDLSILGRSALDRINTTVETRLYSDTYVTGNFGSYSRNNSNSYEWNTDALLNYRKSISENFAIDLNAGANSRVFKADALGAAGANFQIENLFALGNTQDPRPSDTFFRQKEVQSVYGFGELSYKSAIFLNITGRNDWSSTLPASNRSYFYPSVGLTAVISDLIEVPKFIDYAKVRLSYAEVGNDTDPYMLSRLASIVKGAISLSPTLPNVDLKPESTRSQEYGLDLRLFNRLNFDFTYYKTNTYDQLFATPVPIGSGVSSVFQNGADIQNKGFETSLGTRIISRNDLDWNIGINFSRNKSKVLEIAEGFDVLNQADDYIRTYKLIKGEEFGAVYARGYVRDDQGRVIVDAKGLPKLTTGKDIMVANYNPDWLSGITNEFRYKDFNLSTLIDIRQGGTIISFTESIESGVGVLDYTTKGRDGSLIFGENIYENETAVTEAGTPNNIKMSSEDLWNHVGGVGAPAGEAFVRDASNIRLREVVLGYTLPSSLLSKTFFTSARVSLVGRNLFFFSNKAKYVDPEIVTDISNGSEGREALALPTTRSFGMSIRFGF